MKRTIIIILALLCSLTAFGWGRQGHAAVARIAEDHLTPATKAAVSEILEGRSIVEFASYADDYKKSLPFDYGDIFTDGTESKISYPHTFEADMNFVPNRNVSDNGRYVKNCLWFIEKYSDDLRNGTSIDNTSSFIKLVMLVHWLGDMHCPEHIRYYPEDMTIGGYDVIFKGEPLRYHTFWDDQVISVKYPWSFSDLAHLFDSYSEEQIAQIVKGDVWDWGKDSAECSWPIHSIKEGDTIKSAWLLQQLPLVHSQIAKGGYRLAHQLNMIFDRKYARKHSK